MLPLELQTVAAVGGWVTNCIISNRVAVVAGQLIFPVGVGVAVGIGRNGYEGQRAGGQRMPLSPGKIAVRIIDIFDGNTVLKIVLTGKAVVVVVKIGRQQNVGFILYLGNISLKGQPRPVRAGLLKFIVAHR